MLSLNLKSTTPHKSMMLCILQPPQIRHYVRQGFISILEGARSPISSQSAQRNLLPTCCSANHRPDIVLHIPEWFPNAEARRYGSVSKVRGRARNQFDIISIYQVRYLLLLTSSASIFDNITTLTTLPRIIPLP